MVLCLRRDQWRNTVQEKYTLYIFILFYVYFISVWDTFYMKIIVTIVPTKFAIHCPFSLCCLKPKNKNQIFSRSWNVFTSFFNIFSRKFIHRHRHSNLYRYIRCPSLFSIISLDETIDICLDSCYLGLPKKDLQ